MLVALGVTGWPLVQPWMPGAASAAHPASSAAAIDPGWIVVDARDTLTPAELLALESRYALDLEYNSVQSTEEKLLIARTPVGQEAAIAARMDRDPLVEEAEPLYRYSIPEGEAAWPDGPRAPAAATRSGDKWTPNDPRFDEQWNLKLIGAEEAWGRKATGKDVVVAVIDTGVAFENDEDGCYQAKDFSGTAFVKGYDFVRDGDHPNDDHGHGTHVAGTIAESTNNGEGVAGLAFEAKIMPLKVLNQFGGGSSADIADAIRFAADHGANVINMSLGGPMPDPIMWAACKYAKKKGVLIVCAAGNSGGGRVGYPGGFPECLAVSSVGPQGELAPYSSIGKQVAIAAPGGDKSQGERYGVLQNTVLYESGEREDGYFSFQGTSMASPHVAAAAALGMGKGVKDADQVRQILQRAATPKKPAEKYGAGILNAAKTVELTEQAHRTSFFKLLFAGAFALLSVFGGALLGGARAATSGVMPFGFLLGFTGPDVMFRWAGFASPFAVLIHSALLPLYLLWEVESKRAYRFVALMGLGSALHLGWNAFHGNTPFAGVLPDHGVPWLWINALVGAGVAVVAFRRSNSAT